MRGQILESQKFRCEILRTFGYVFCTPLCMTILQALLPMKILYNERLFGKIFISLLLFIVGVYYILDSYSEMKKHDDIPKPTNTN